LTIVSTRHFRRAAPTQASRLARGPAIGWVIRLLLACAPIFLTGLSIGTAELAMTGPVQAQNAVPFDKDLQRLSEILGSLHYLREICGANEGPKWRQQMQALLDAEAPSGERHDQLIARFNDGYRGFRQTYRTCTPAARVAIRRYLEEGTKISRDLTARYSN
jgi:uncharacterized protein (TIGR02301 family)